MAHPWHREVIMAFYQRVNQAADLRIKRAKRTITTTDLTTSGPQQKFDFTAALPTNAYFLGAYVDVTTQFTDGAAGTATADLGIKTTDEDAFLDAADLSTAAGKINIPRGALQTGFMGGVTVTITIDGSVDVDTFTAGSATFHVIYLEIDAIQV